MQLEQFDLGLGMLAGLFFALIRLREKYKFPKLLRCDQEESLFDKLYPGIR
jgi:hypothetical protein